MQKPIKKVKPIKPIKKAFISIEIDAISKLIAKNKCITFKEISDNLPKNIILEDLIIESNYGRFTVSYKSEYDYNKELKKYNEDYAEYNLYLVKKEEYNQFMDNKEKVKKLERMRLDLEKKLKQINYEVESAKSL